jgi:hypothetical protein
LGANPQDLRGLVAMFHIAYTMYSNTSNHSCFKSASSRFYSYAGTASEYPVLDTRVFLVIL